MTKLKQLELAVDALAEQDYGQFRRWFLERDWARRDKQIEADSAAGKLDFLLKEAREAKAQKTLKAL